MFGHQHPFLSPNDKWFVSRPSAWDRNARYVCQGWATPSPARVPGAKAATPDSLPRYTHTHTAADGNISVRPQKGRRWWRDPQVDQGRTRIHYMTYWTVYVSAHTSCPVSNVRDENATEPSFGLVFPWKSLLWIPALKSMQLGVPASRKKKSSSYNWVSLRTFECLLTFYINANEVLLRLRA